MKIPEGDKSVYETSFAGQHTPFEEHIIPSVHFSDSRNARGHIYMKLVISLLRLFIVRFYQLSLDVWSAWLPLVYSWIQLRQVTTTIRFCRVRYRLTNKGRFHNVFKNCTDGFKYRYYWYIYTYVPWSWKILEIRIIINYFTNATLSMPCSCAGQTRGLGTVYIVSDIKIRWCQNNKAFLFNSCADCVFGNDI